MTSKRSREISSEQAHIPAEQPSSCKDPRFPCPHAYPRWPCHPRRSSCKGSHRAKRLAASLLPKQNRLRSGDEIRATMKAGKRSSNQTLTFHYLSGSGRFAFITPKSIGNAVVRNRVKRRGRAAVAKHLSALSQIDGVFRFHPAAGDQSFDEIASSIQNLLNRAQA